MVPPVGQRCVIVVFPDHTRLLFLDVFVLRKVVSDCDFKVAAGFFSSICVCSLYSDCSFVLFLGARVGLCI